jgi:uncharacterized lipoprotein YbaY
LKGAGTAALDGSAGGAGGAAEVAVTASAPSAAAAGACWVYGAAPTVPVVAAMHLMTSLLYLVEIEGALPPDAPLALKLRFSDVSLNQQPQLPLRTLTEED